MTDRFSEQDLEGLAPAPRALLSSAIEVGTPLAAGSRLDMRGAIKLTRWLPFRGTEVIAPGFGFIWRARVAGVISGFDRYVDGVGEMQWKLAHLVTVASFSGTDVSRSAAGREAAEAIWAPTALLPRFGVEWCGTDDTHATARVPTRHGPVDVHYEIDGRGHVRSILVSRWGDPENTGRSGLHAFGGAMTDHETFKGVTIPSRGTVGWHFGERGSESGAFFRFRITDLQPVT